MPELIGQVPEEPDEEFFEAINLKKLVPGLPVDSIPRLLSVILFARKRMAKNA